MRAAEHIQSQVAAAQRNHGDQLAGAKGITSLAEFHHGGAVGTSGADGLSGENGGISIEVGGIATRSAHFCEGDLIHALAYLELHAVDYDRAANTQLLGNRLSKTASIARARAPLRHILYGNTGQIVDQRTFLGSGETTKGESKHGGSIHITSTSNLYFVLFKGNIGRLCSGAANGDLADVIVANVEPTAQRTVGGNFRINLGGVGIQAVPGKHGGLRDEVHPTSVGNERVNEVEAIGQAGGVFHVVVGALAQTADVIGAAVEAADSGGVDFDLSVGPDVVGGEQIGHGQLDGKVYVSAVNGGSGVIGIEVGRADLAGRAGILDHVDAIAEGISGAGSGAPVKSSRHRGDAQNHDHRESDRKNLLHVFYSLSEKFVLMQVRATCFSTRQ